MAMSSPRFLPRPCAGLVLDLTTKDEGENFVLETWVDDDLPAPPSNAPAPPAPSAPPGKNTRRDFLHTLLANMKGVFLASLGIMRSLTGGPLRDMLFRAPSSEEHGGSGEQFQAFFGEKGAGGTTAVVLIFKSGEEANMDIPGGDGRGGVVGPPPPSDRTLILGFMQFLFRTFPDEELCLRRLFARLPRVKFWIDRSSSSSTSSIKMSTISPFLADLNMW